MSISSTDPGGRLREHLCLRVAVAVLLLGAGTGAADSGTETLRKLFPYQAELAADGAGLCHLELPPKVVAMCRPDLSDMRILGAAGQELAYAVDTGLPGDAEVVRRVAAEILAVDRSEVRPEHGPATFHESYILAVPDLPAEATFWELVLEPDTDQFTGRIDISAGDDGGGLRPVVEQGSVFRLRSPGGERLRFPIPVPDATRLSVKLVTEGLGFLQPNLSLEATHALPGRQPAAVRLRVSEIAHGHRSTRVELERPSGLVPSRLRVATATPAFHRRVTVDDGGPGADRSPLGGRAVFRIDAIAPVEETDIDLRPARGSRLVVTIDNGDSPPLEDLEFHALIRRPVVFLALPADTRTGTVLFGAGRARRPRYDLSVLAPPAPPPVAGDAARRALLFWDPRRTPTARLGNVVPNPRYDPAPALAFAMRPGAPLNPQPYSHQRSLAVDPSAEGLSRLRLTAADLAVARQDIGDLRIIDAGSHQWAYLVERDTAVAEVGLVLAGVRRDDDVSRYTLRPPHSPIVVSRLTPVCESAFFDRAIEVTGVLPGSETTVLATGRLARRHNDPQPPVISFPARRIEALELIVHDGDDAPLDFTSFTARTTLSDIFVAAPAGTYTLLVGNPSTVAPEYELERVRSAILAVPSSEIGSGPLEANPSFKASSRLLASSARERVLLWAVLGLAVIALAVLTLRLARQERTD